MSVLGLRTFFAKTQYSLSMGNYDVQAFGPASYVNGAFGVVHC